METKNENKVLAYAKKHAVSICASFGLVALIVFILYFLRHGNEEQIFNPDWGIENVWCSPWGTGSAIIGLLIVGIILIILQIQFDSSDTADSFIHLKIVWPWTSILLLWCWFFGISFIVPITMASVAYLIYSYKKHETKRSFVWDMVRFIFAMITVCIATYSVSKNKVDEFHQEIAIIKMTVKEPVIEVVDAKSDCVLSKEYGLEKIINDERPQKGDKIHRLSVGKGEVYVIICKRK